MFCSVGVDSPDRIGIQSKQSEAAGFFFPSCSHRSCVLACQLFAQVIGRWCDRVLRRLGVVIMHWKPKENGAGKRLAACAAAAMVGAAVLAGAASAGAAPTQHKSAASSKEAAGSLPPIRSANGKTAPSSASGSAGWHVAQALSGPGHSSAKALHVFLPRTNRLVAPFSSSRGVPQPTAPGARTSHTAGVAPPRSLNVRPPVSARRSASPADITIGTSFNGSGYTGWIPPDGGLAAGPHQVIVAINGAFNVYGKGGTLLSSQSLGSFFTGLPDAGTAFDPHVRFDPNSQRFWIVAAATDGSTSSE